MCRSLCRTNAISYGGRIRYGGTDDYKIVYVDHVDIAALKPEYTKSWWRHQMDIFSPLLSLCESPVDPSKGQWRGALIFLFDLCLNKRLSKQSRRRWFETPSRSLCRHCNVMLLGLRSVISMLLLFKQQPKIQRDKITLKKIEKSKNHYPVVHQSSQQLNDNRWYTDIGIYHHTTRQLRPFFMMTSSNGNIFRVTGHLCGEFTGPRWIPRTKASEAELWCFLWSASE